MPVSNLMGCAEYAVTAAVRSFKAAWMRSMGLDPGMCTVAGCQERESEIRVRLVVAERTV